MSRRQTPRPDKLLFPRVWLMTDPRFGSDLLPAIQRMPARSGVIFRHYDMQDTARRTLFRKVRRICARRGHILLLAGDERTAMRWHAAGFHQRGARRQSKATIYSAAVHNRLELAGARRSKVDFVLISPVFATNSHPDVGSLGRVGLMALARQAGEARVIALGGMTAQKAATLDKRIVHGWAAIVAFRLKQI